jgi:hypothetical protein
MYMCEQCIEGALIAREREIVPEVETSTRSPEPGQQTGLTRVRQEVNDDAKERENEKLMGSEL